ncbi:MAG: DUF917 domain-containing protein [Acidimicrobiaceae bacterium]|nr:DUF917 domain-containing protein [Acidimicrobiaceae bacterium]MCY4175068.1 DUF917 domain-containing protein [Acidimicrobiaceae bacterium]MCY4279903.1 DUF917 domain-containing protein [Acidimicrobiaceae bacterium]MCY4294942.1 DUF917 domain-containing protein [Acidimicrobiaceae bacterium]
MAMDILTTDDIEAICLGATLLGTGGGGDPYIAKLVAHQALETYGPVKVVEAADLEPDALVLTTAIIGAPTVILEKIPAGTEFVAGVRALSKYLGKAPAAIMIIEVGGLNTLLPIATAAEMGLPVVNADSMRRAFPQIEMTVFTLAGLPAGPLTVADEKGNQCVFETTTNQVAESLARAAVIKLGLANAISCYPLTAGQIAEHGITGSLTYCAEMGRMLQAVKDGHEGAWEHFLSESGSHQFFTGKVVDLDRRTTDGFARSTLILEDLEGSSATMRIEVQNENLLAFLDGEPVITTPNLICLLDCETFDPITTESIAYGNRVVVIGMPCAPQWHREGMLDLVGPKAFGYDIDFVELPS